MAHFAKIDQSGTVVDVVKVADEVLLDENGEENEELGIKFLQDVLGGPYDWKQTSYNAFKGRHRLHLTAADGEHVEPVYGTKECMRKNYASIGGKYDYERNAFIGVMPDTINVVLDEDTCYWECPYESNQTTDNTGNPLPYADQTDYKPVNSNLNASRNWIWDDVRKTYIKVPAFETVPVNYVYNSIQGKWVKQYF